jgi:hypothetical protein
VLNLIHQQADFDRHHRLILELVKLPAFWRTLLGLPVRSRPMEDGYFAPMADGNGTGGLEEERVAEMASRPTKLGGDA